VGLLALPKKDKIDPWRYQVCLPAYKDLISFLIIMANEPTCRANEPRANRPDTAKDLFYPFLATPTAPHSKKCDVQLKHANTILL
jgi:hypothetical protein